MSGSSCWTVELLEATAEEMAQTITPGQMKLITEARTEFLTELREKHLVDDAIFLVDGAPWLQAACHRHSLRFQHVTHGNRNAVERVFKELKRRTESFANHFRHADPNTAETWLQAFAVCFNQLI
jgi:transposase-like protein